MQHPVVEKLSAAYAELSGEIASYLARKLGLSPQAAEDIVHGAFESTLGLAHEKLEKIKNARAFMYRSAYNAGVDYCRHAQVGQRHIEEISHDSHKHVEQLDPFRSLAGKQELDVLMSTLEKMPDKRRKLVLMNRVQGMSYAEISRRVSLSETVVRKHVARAVKDLLSAMHVRTGKSLQ